MTWQSFANQYGYLMCSMQRQRLRTLGILLSNDTVPAGRCLQISHRIQLRNIWNERQLNKGTRGKKKEKKNPPTLWISLCYTWNNYKRENSTFQLKSFQRTEVMKWCRLQSENFAVAVQHIWNGEPTLSTAKAWPGLAGKSSLLRYLIHSLLLMSALYLTFLWPFQFSPLLENNPLKVQIPPDHMFKLTSGLFFLVTYCRCLT